MNVMPETRGRRQNTSIIIKCHELADQGKSRDEISAELNISVPMVRYYLSQKPRPSQYKCLASCFFKQPREVQVAVAKLIGYTLPDELQDSTTEEVNNLYEQLKEDDLFKRVKDLLTGKIQMHEVDEEFNLDEKKKLQKSKTFLRMTMCIIKGEPDKTPVEEAIEIIKGELKND